jgi:SAM-dependent methyltransferase
VTRFIERAVWGDLRRERLLLALLRRHYESVYRRQWFLAAEPPHYFDHRIGSFAFATGAGHPYSYYRGFFAGEIVHDGDVLLDIGCGDGFFARRFFAPKCAHVDGIDVDRGAVEHASRLNGAPNITYFLIDAVTDPFPRKRYDVIVLDGALGHFSSAASAVLLGKIREGLAEDGVFVGSESLGTEGHDHLQFFEALPDLASTLAEHFEHVQMRSLRYFIPAGIQRHEAYWRCAASRTRLDEASWREYGASHA